MSSFILSLLLSALCPFLFFPFCLFSFHCFLYYLVYSFIFPVCSVFFYSFLLIVCMIMSSFILSVFPIWSIPRFLFAFYFFYIHLLKYNKAIFYTKHTYLMEIRAVLFLSFITATFFLQRILL